MSQNPTGQGADETAPDEQLENAIELKETEGLSQGQIVRRRFFRHRGAVAGMVAIALILLLSVTALGVGPIPGWWSATGRPEDVLNGGRPSLSLPTWLGGDGFAIGAHPFGQDEIGRDTFAQVMQGVRTSFMVMLTMSAVAAVLGVLVGALAGFYRGLLDTILMRMTDLVITVPVLVIGAVIGRLAGRVSPFVFALAIGLVLWTSLARLVRAEFLSLREREFVDAARVAGASDARIIFKHMLPNAMGVIIVTTSLLLSSAILLEAALSYLGFGILSPDVSLGRLISDNQGAFATRPWLFWWPGLFIIAIALSINFIGDGLRDAFDPRQKRIPSLRKMAKSLARQSSGDASAPPPAAAGAGSRS